MPPDQLRAFLTIAELGNLTHAALRLNKTQSAVSVQIKNLEARLGVSLFARGARGMSLTAEGQRLKPFARAAMEAHEAIDGLFKDPLTGNLRIGVPDDFEDGRLERALVAFSTAHPGVDVHVTAGCSQDFAPSVAEGALDVAVVSGPQFIGQMPLYEERLVWAAARGAHASSQDPIPLAVVDHGCWFGRLPMVALEQSRRPYRLALSSGSFASVCAAVRTGLAVSMLPERVLSSDLVTLGEADGFPPLPKLRRSILRRQGGPEHLALAMTDALLALVTPEG